MLSKYLSLFLCLSTLFICSCHPEESPDNSPTESKTIESQTLEEVDPCFAQRIELALGQKVSVKARLFTGEPTALDLSRVLSDFKNGLAEYLHITDLRVALEPMNFGIWKTFLPGEDVLVLDEHRKTVCLLSDSATNGADYKTILLGNRSAISTGLLSQESVYEKLKTCLSQKLPGEPVPSLLQSQVTYDTIVFTFDAMLTQKLPESATENYKKQFALTFSDSIISELPLIMESFNQRHYFWFSSFQEGCDHLAIEQDNPHFLYK